MLVSNKRDFPVWVRGFVRGMGASQDKLVFPDGTEEVFGPDIPQYGLIPYRLEGYIVVGNAASNILQAKTMYDVVQTVVVEAGTLTTIARPGRFGRLEGVHLCHFNDNFDDFK